MYNNLICCIRHNKMPPKDVYERNDKLKEYHILSLSGGKDSTALAFFMKDNMQDIFEKTELVFCDTECEIPETLYIKLNLNIF